ncbi:hypothetical protein LTR66_007233 [Elasticomyces elasticus]|nr:hypothetical protein LTR66_007233 [Elasticomyces elasticus]
MSSSTPVPTSPTMLTQASPASSQVSSVPSTEIATPQTTIVSTPTVVGIAVGVFVCASIIAAVAGMLWRRRRRRSGSSDDHPAHPEQPELDSEPKVELDTERPRVELEDSGRRELDGSGVDWIRPKEQKEPIELEAPANRQV